MELQSSSGGSVMIGVVEKIDPMRTVLRTDDNIPVGVPNKAITDMIISNESRISRVNAITQFKVLSFPDKHDSCIYSSAISAPASRTKIYSSRHGVTTQSTCTLFFSLLVHVEGEKGVELDRLPSAVCLVASHSKPPPGDIGFPCQG